VLGVTEETVLAWPCGGAQAEVINRHCLRDLPVTQVQLERCELIARKHACETDATGESLLASEDGRQWIWISFAPEFRLMIAAIVGPRTLDTAKEVVATPRRASRGLRSSQRRLHVLSGSPYRCLPRRDHVCAHRQARAPTPARCEPHPDLISQLVKQKQRGKLLTLQHRVVLGAERLRTWASRSARPGRNG